MKHPSAASSSDGATKPNGATNSSPSVSPPSLRIAYRIGPLVLAAQTVPLSFRQRGTSTAAPKGPNVKVFDGFASRGCNPRTTTALTPPTPKGLNTVAASAYPNKNAYEHNPRLVLDPPLETFRISETTDGESIHPDLLLDVKYAASLTRPAGPIVWQHRAGWDLYRCSEEYVAVKAIPYGSDRILRRVTLGRDESNRGGAPAQLQIAPEDDRPEEPFAYTLSELLALLLTRISRAVLLHAACVVADGEAILFAGMSGSGKSTMASLWDLSGRATVLGDESHLLWTDPSGQVLVSGTPWPGSSGLYSNQTAPLGRVYFLEHGPRNFAEPLAPADGMLNLMSHAFLPSWDPAAMEIVTDLCGRIAERHSLSRLAFVPDASVVDFVMNSPQRHREKRMK